MTGQDEIAAVDGPATAAERVFRDERASVLATLIRLADDFQLAEDAMQDAFESALATWPKDGIPRNPGAWITVAARGRAIDRLRRNRSVADRAARLAELIRLDDQEDPAVNDDGVLDDDRLRLIFTCCHPALDQSAQVALHIQAPSPDDTDWARIASLYAALGQLSPSPVIGVNHAAAVGFAHGPQAGLRLLGPLLADPALDHYQPLHATHAELLRRAGDRPGAAHAYQRAIELTDNAVERAELRRRLDTLSQNRQSEGAG